MKKWLKQSLIWTVWITFGMGVVFPFLGREEITLSGLALRFIIFLGCALPVGYFFVRKQTHKSISHEKMD